MEFFFIILISTGYIHQTRAHIIIQIEAEDMQRITDILQSSHQRSDLISTGKTISKAVLQMLGIMLTLVGANLLTSKLEPAIGSPVHFTYINRTTPSDITDMCKYDYGCDDNLCWRTCDGEVDALEKRVSSWCHTTISTQKPEYKECVNSYECSPCWDCLTPCNSANKAGIIWDNVNHDHSLNFNLSKTKKYIIKSKIKHIIIKPKIEVGTHVNQARIFCAKICLQNKKVK